MSDDMKFKECPECSARSGTPELCDSCAHNRKVIGKLREDREEWECERAQLEESHDDKDLEISRLKGVIEGMRMAMLPRYIVHGLRQKVDGVFIDTDK